MYREFFKKTISKYDYMYFFYYFCMGKAELLREPLKK